MGYDTRNVGYMQKAFKKEDEVVIFADARELNSKVIEILKKKCIVRESSLPVADYLLSERVGVERKASRDFLKSIIDGRLFKQLANLKDNYDKPLLIIEGNNLLDEGMLHPNAVRGAITSVAIEFSIPIIWTKNPGETAEMLFTIARREQIKLNKSVSIRTKRRFLSENQQQEFLISGLSGVSTVTAKRLLKHFKTPERVFSASEKELQDVEGIGKVMAKNIKKVLQKKYEKSALED